MLALACLVMAVVSTPDWYAHVEQVSCGLLELGRVQALGGDHGPPAATQLDGALVAQRRVGPQHGVHVDPEARGEVAGARELVAGADVTAEDGAADLRHELSVERLGRLGVDGDQHPSTIVVLEQLEQVVRGSGV